MSTQRKKTLARFGRGSMAVSAVAGAVFAMTLQGSLTAQPSDAAMNTQTVQDGMITRLSAKELGAVLTSNGFTDVDVEDSETVYARTGGILMVFLVYEDGESFQANAVWNLGDDTASLFDLNDWNTEYRFSKAIRLDSGNPCIQLDLDMAGGVTRKRVDDYLRIVKFQVELFRKEVIDKEG